MASEPPTSHGTEGKLPGRSEPQFPHLLDGIIVSPPHSVMEETDLSTDRPGAAPAEEEGVAVLPDHLFLLGVV